MDGQAPARQIWPNPADDQIGRDVANSPYPTDTVKLKKADNTNQPLGGDACDLGAASKGKGRRE